MSQPTPHATIRNTIIEAMRPAEELASLCIDPREEQRLTGILFACRCAIQSGGTVAMHPAGWQPTPIPTLEALEQDGGLTVAEAAERLARHPTQIRRWCEAGDLRAARTDAGRWVIDAASVERFVPRGRGERRAG